MTTLFSKGTGMITKEQLQVSIGRRVKELREAKKLPQQSLADACGFENSNMARLEAGNTNPTLFTLLKIAQSLNTTLEELVKNLDSN